MNRTFSMGIAVAFGLLAGVGMTGCGATTASQPLAETQPQANALPRTEDDLRNLDNTHADIVRRAQRQCAAEGWGVTPGNEFELPCLTLAVDRAVADSDDSALQAYHDALPRRERYDPRRSDNVWREMIEERSE